MFDSLPTIAGVVVPVFAIVGFGWLTARIGLLKEHVGETLADFVFTIAIPLLLFRTLATADIPAISPFPLWISYFAAVAVTWFTASFITRRVFGRDARGGVISGVSAAFSNNILIGLPVVLIVFGEDGAVPMIVLVAIHLPAMMTAGTILVERAERIDNPDAKPLSAGKLLKSIGRNLARSPIIYGILGGLLWRVTGWPLAGIPRTAVDMLANAGVPCALFGLGMALRRFGLRGNVAPALVTTGLKVVVMPALVWLFAAKVAHLPPLWATVATVAGACPTGVNAWLIANRFNTGHGIAANTITLTTAASVVTLSLVLTLLT